MDLVGYDPLDHNSSDPMAVPGQIYRWKRNATSSLLEYGACLVRYVKAEDANISAGDVVQWGSADGIEVTNDRSGGSAIANTVAGVALDDITDGNWGFIQVAGVGQVALTTSGSVAAGTPLMIDASNDGQCVAATYTSTAPTVAELYVLLGGTFGIALAADSSTTLAAQDYIIKGLI